MKRSAALIALSTPAALSGTAALVASMNGELSLCLNGRNTGMKLRTVLIAVSTLCTTLLAPLVSAQQPGNPEPAKAYCAKLRPRVQPLVKPALSLVAANDGSTDSLHTGERSYVDCDFRQQSGQLEVSLHDDDDGLFDDPTKQGYAALPGFGDTARYSVRGSMGMRWVDVVRGKVACEVRFSLEDGDFNADWKTAGGRICEAALATQRS